jgi:hypothetical protein
MDLLRYLQNAHTYHFTLDTLRRLAASEGLELIAGDETIRATFRASLGATTELPNPRLAVLELQRHLHQIERWRRILPVSPIKVLSFLKRSRRALRWQLPRQNKLLT